MYLCTVVLKVRRICSTSLSVLCVACVYEVMVLKMNVRCVNQHLSEQFRRVISSNFVTLLTGSCSRDFPFPAVSESQNVPGLFKLHNQLSQSRLQVAGAGCTSCSLLVSSHKGAVETGAHLNLQGQEVSTTARRRNLSSQIGLGELGARQKYSTSVDQGVMKKGSAVWKEKKRVRSVSSAAEVCRGDAETTAKAGGEEVTTISSEISGGAVALSGSAGKLVNVDSSSETVHVDTMLLRFLVGKGGSTKEKVEKDCGVKLRVPSTHEAKSSKSGCSVVVTGTESGIEAAKKQIKLILDEAVQSKLQYTHFISLPLTTHPDLLEQVEKFQKAILARNQPSPSNGESSISEEEKTKVINMEKGIVGETTISQTKIMDMEKGVVEDTRSYIPHRSGIDKSIFVKPRTFHLTILMLKLWNEERVQAAADVLEKTIGSVGKALDGKAVVLDFKGVEIMKGKPDKAHVLFARVEDSSEKTRLLMACQLLIDAYVESGLVMEKDIDQTLKLHATLMNTTYRTVKKNNRFGKRIPFDATEILEQYGEWRWGEFAILEAHLSQRFVYGENGYYHCVKGVPLPSPLPNNRQAFRTGSQNPKVKAGRGSA